LLDAVAAGLRFWPEVNLSELPRMADSARWGEAVARGLGWAPGTFLAAYHANRRSASQTVLEDSPVALAILDHLESMEPWRRTATELLQDLNNLTYHKRTASLDWPRTPRALSCILRRLAPQLRMTGIIVTFVQEHKGRIITISRVDGPANSRSLDPTELLRQRLQRATTNHNNLQRMSRPLRDRLKFLQ
jgi:hypothetical protein